MDFEASAEYRPTGTGFGPDNHLEQIKASYAYARGATGAGETIVIADSGFNAAHHELSGTVSFGGRVANKFTQVASYGPACTPAQLMARICAGTFHGTATAGIAAGRRDLDATVPRNMHGVAFDANILGVRHRIGDTGGSPPPDPAPLILTDFGYYAVILYQTVIRDPTSTPGTYTFRIGGQRGPIINLSFGGSTGEGISSRTREYVRNRYSSLANLFAQDARNPATGNFYIEPADRSIIVWSAGNGGTRADGDSPTILPGLGVYFERLRPHVIAVVNVRRDGHIASGSNRCGLAKSFCIAAPGTGLVAPGSVTDQTGPLTYFASFSGTSAAAPVVSGALAVMRSFFRNPPGSPMAGEPSLGNTELVTRLLATADSSDSSASGGPDYSDSDIYGHGLVDLDAATRPMGTMMATTSDGRSWSASATSLDITHGAFGGALGRALDGVPMVFFDQLGSPFFHDAGQLVRAAPAGDLANFAAASAPENVLLRLDSGASSLWLAHNTNGARPLGLLRADERFSFSNHDAFAAPYFSLVKHGFGGGFEAPTGGRGGFGLAVMHGAAWGRGGGGVYGGGDGYGGGGGDYGGGGGVDAWKNGTALAFGYRPANRAFSLLGGVVREGEGFLGARPGGAMGEARGETVFAGVNGSWGLGGLSNLGLRRFGWERFGLGGLGSVAGGAGSGSAAGGLGSAGLSGAGSGTAGGAGSAGSGDLKRGWRAWRVLASAYVGHTRANASSGLLHSVSGLRSSAFSLGLSRRSALRKDDWLGFRLTQPMRVESGHARLRIPTARNPSAGDGHRVLYTDIPVNLKPRARTLQAEAAWRTPALGGHLSLGLQLTRHPNHDPDGGTGVFGWVRFGRGF